jgi:hypothetical protein
VAGGQWPVVSNAPGFARDSRGRLSPDLEVREAAQIVSFQGENEHERNDQSRSGATNEQAGV